MIYKRTQTGAIQTWQILVENNTFCTIEGQLDGKLTTSKPTKCFAKNIGRANETTGEDQALAEALRKWQHKVDKRGYTTDIDKVDRVQAKYDPMLAHKYKDYADLIKWPVFIQRKSDGARCIMTRHGARSRNDGEWVTIPHIREALKPFFQKYPHAILDGEIYNHKLHDDFNKIMSLAKKTKPSIQDLFDAEEILEYHIYDAPVIGNFTEKDLFSVRYNFMANELQGTKHVHIVETYTARDEKEMKSYYERFLKEGYEGLMIRIDKPYQNKRTKYLLKVKPHMSEEFKLIGLRPGKGNKSGMAAHADFRTKDSKPFTANIKGTHVYLKELLIRREDALGKLCTVEFQNYTPDGIPRFPYMTSIRDYE